MVFTAFKSKKKAERVTGRLIVRRIPELNSKDSTGPETLFDTYRFHAFFTTTDPDILDPVAADKTHSAQCHHRASSCRPKERLFGLDAIRQFQRERRLAWRSGHGVQSFPRRRHSGRITIGQSHHGKHPGQNHQRGRAYCVLGPPSQAAFAHKVAVAEATRQLFDTIYPPPKIASIPVNPAKRRNQDQP